MNDPPVAIFSAEDCRSPQGDRSQILASANSGLVPFDLHNVPKVGSRELGYPLESALLAVAVVGRSTLRRLSNLFPSTNKRAKRVAETCVISMRVHLLCRFRVAI